jgi:hypothetical protein
MGLGAAISRNSESVVEFDRSRYAWMGKWQWS